MNIYAIMLVKNEADIVESVIKDAERWADKIFILDNGSTDGTWETVQSLKNDVIVPWKQYFGAYHNGLRAEVFNAFRNISKDGDWWCFKLDADEFYVENPRDFLANVPKNCHLVAKKSLDYFISPEDIEEHEFTGIFESDRDKIKYIKKECWCEPRFFRYRKNLAWSCDPQNHYPPRIGVLSDHYILVRHYQYRSPQQMQKRLDVRNASQAKKAGLAFRHVKETDWHELLKARDELVFDDGQIETYRTLPVRNNIKQGYLKKMIMRILIALRIYDAKPPMSYTTPMMGGVSTDLHFTHCCLPFAA